MEILDACFLLLTSHSYPMRLPVIEGLIKRRLLINFRADSAAVQKILPAGFRPKLHQGHAIVGICLIRLEQIRPKGLPALLGVSSENAAHRIAMEWTDTDGTAREGVFIPRRDTDSLINALGGGRLFPGEHHHSRFHVEDDGTAISFSMLSPGGEASIHVKARAAEALPADSIFGSLAETSAFFEKGCVGFSVTCDPKRLDGLELKTKHWEIHPLDVQEVRSTFFEDPARFPKGTIHFDHALVMRNIPHEWHSVADYTVPS